MKYKGVVTDLDGTLLGSDHKVSDFTKEVIKNIIKKDIKFFIATGRNYNLAKVVMDSIGIKIPLISSNGARINDENGNVIYENNLEQEEVNAILDINYKEIDEKIRLNIFSGDDWIIPIGATKNINPEEMVDIQPIEMIVEEMKKRKILKFFFTCDNHESLVKLEEKLLKLSKNISLAFVDLGCLEIFSKNANKGNAAKQLVEKYGMNMSEIVTFGDAANDYELLTISGKGFAMGNAIDRLLEKLPKNFEKIGKNSEDGEAKKLIELFLK